MRTTRTLLALFTLGGLIAGCPSQDIWVYDGTGGGSADAGNPCDGQCLPYLPFNAGWTEPALLWVGKATEIPDCPERAPIGDVLAFADPELSNVCGACACDPPSGACTVPTTWTAYNTTSCPAPPGSTATSFNAFAGWDGSCTTVNAIPAGKMCNGSACVQSLSIAPLVLNEGACVSHVEPVVVPKNSAGPWGTVARVCRGDARGECDDPHEQCTPAGTPANAAPTSNSFAQCVSHEGDMECASVYTVKHVLYKSFVDNRTCTPCACDAPTGSTCMAQISVFRDGACSSPVLGSNTIDAVKPYCFDIAPSGQALLSKSVDEPVYAPGACQATGGDTMGEVIPTDPMTFCCLP